MGINPFDEPNVQQAKDATRVILQSYTATHQLATPTPDRILPGEIALTLSDAARETLHGQGADAFADAAPSGRLPSASSRTWGLTRNWRRSCRTSDAPSAIEPAPPRCLDTDHAICIRPPAAQGWSEHRRVPVDHRVATTDVPIPGEPFSFGTLEQAQALGDFASLGPSGGARCTRTCRRRIANWFGGLPTHCSGGCSPTARARCHKERRCNSASSVSVVWASTW
jgi:hypothetical protein